MIIAVAATKGGAGKSTIAVNLAVIEALAGRTVLLVDTDIQGTSRDWLATREQENREPRLEFIQVTGTQTFDVIQERAKHFETVIVDCGGRQSAELQLSLAAADVIAVPVQPSNADAWAFTDTMQAIDRAVKAVGQDIPTVAFVSRGSTNSKDREAADVLRFLKQMPGLRVLVERTSERKVYRDALALGLGVSELKAKNKKEAPAIEKAQAELTALHQALMAAGAVTSSQELQSTAG